MGTARLINSNRRGPVSSRGKPHVFGRPVMLKVGDRVRLWGEMHGLKDGRRVGYGRPEYGYVARVEPHPTIAEAFDVWTDFYGRRRADFEKKRGKPYRLRYFHTSLELLRP